jgi:hypothetical protein
VAALSLAFVAAACSDNPVAPTRAAQPPPLFAFPSPPPSGPTSASLRIENFSVIVKPSRMNGRAEPVAVTDGWFSLEVRFLLRETGGKSGATVNDFFVEHGVLGGGAWFGGPCGGGFRVPPGDVYDTLNTDDGFASWGYCAPYLGVEKLGEEYPLFLTVYFEDDEGNPGSVRVEAIRPWTYY